jgi:hypothetical protein
MQVIPAPRPPINAPANPNISPVAIHKIGLKLTPKTNAVGNPIVRNNFPLLAADFQILWLGTVVLSTSLNQP